MGIEDVRKYLCYELHCMNDDDDDGHLFRILPLMGTGNFLIDTSTSEAQGLAMPVYYKPLCMMSVTVFWVATLCGLAGGYQQSGGTYCHHL